MAVVYVCLVNRPVRYQPSYLALRFGDVRRA